MPTSVCFPGGFLRGDVNFRMDRSGNVDFKTRIGVYIPNQVPVVVGRPLVTFQATKVIRPNGPPQASWAGVGFQIGWGIASLTVFAKIDFRGEIWGWVDPLVISKKYFQFWLPGTREFVIPYTEETQPLILDPEVIGYASPTLVLDSATTVAGTPDAKITFTATSEVPDEAIIDLYVDSVLGSYEGELLASLPYQPGQQAYDWNDLAAYTPVLYDPNEPLYVYGAISDHGHLAVFSDHSGPIVPPNMTPKIMPPTKQDFGANQLLLLSTVQGMHPDRCDADIDSDRVR